MNVLRIARANLFALAAALLLATPAFAADAPAPAPSVEAQVQALVAKLRSDDPDERGKALEALVALGPGARAPLEAEQAKAKDMDLKTQLHLALEGLDAGSAMARYEHPKTIDLAAKGLSVKDALERLHKHFGWKLEADGAAAAKSVDLDLKGATFFQAVEALRAGAKLAYSSDNGLGGHQLYASGAPQPAGTFAFKLVPAAADVPAAFTAGPFLLYLDRYSLYAMRTLTPESGASTEQKTVTLQAVLVAEPGVPVSSAVVYNVELKDAKGNVVWNRPDPLNGFGLASPTAPGTAQSSSAQLGFQAPAELPGPLAWAGKITATVPLKMETYRIEDLEAADQKPLQFGDSKITIEKPRKDAQYWSVSYTETMGPSSAATGLGAGGLGGGAAGGAMVRSVSSARFGAASGGDVVGGAEGEAAEGAGVPENEEGWFWLDEKGQRMQSLGGGGGGSETEWHGHVTLSGKPKSLVIRKVTKSAMKEYPFAFAAIPAPDFSAPAAPPAPAAPAAPAAKP